MYMGFPPLGAPPTLHRHILDDKTKNMDVLKIFGLNRTLRNLTEDFFAYWYVQSFIFVLFLLNSAHKIIIFKAYTKILTDLL